VVGVNAFTEGDDGDLEILKVGNEAAEAQEARLASLRASRDAARVQSALDALRAAARAGQNVIEPMLECVRAYATLYEIRRALEDVFGAYREPLFF